ncbi:MAG: glucosaminidase domain-containing protein [Verrucomicrobiota bacterium JB022]|nr:glucosaminidase domain-containing protein [Verrucomicrobiota bacterium JB022]
MLVILATAGIGFNSAHHSLPRYEWVRRTLPDFNAFNDPSERKQAFISFLAPQIEIINERILSQRQRLYGIWQHWQNTGELPDRDESFLDELALEYRFTWPGTPTEADFQALAERVDTIPVGLAIAQAALETGWGTSSLARFENNLYGMLCYEPGCGKEPTDRPPHLPYYEYATYPSVTASLRAYVRNLNTNNAYRELRAIRSEMRGGGMDATGHALAAGLVLYSDEGELYIVKIRNIIRQNRLDEADGYLAGPAAPVLPFPG